MVPSRGGTAGVDVECSSGTAVALALGNAQTVALPHCDLLVSNVGQGYTLLCGPNQGSVNACSSLLYSNGGALAWLVFIQNVQIYLR